jgi:hypothetical protein
MTFTFGIRWGVLSYKNMPAMHSNNSTINVKKWVYGGGHLLSILSELQGIAALKPNCNPSVCVTERGL